MRSKIKMTMWWPLALLFVSNVAYNYLAKSLPKEVNAYAALTVIYSLSAVISIALFLFTSKDASLIEECRKMNMIAPLIALCVIGMELGTIYLYKVGWPLSVGMLINNALVSVCLVIIGYLVFRESLNVEKLVGIVLVLSGLYLINK